MHSTPMSPIEQAAALSKSQASLTTTLEAQNFLKITELAKIFSVTSTTIKNWTRNPKVKFPRPFTVGTKLYFRKSEIEAYLLNPDSMSPDSN